MPTTTWPSSVDYFHDPAGEILDDGPGSYADLDAPTDNNATLEWAWPVSDVISAVLGAGLELELFHEHDYTLFARWPDLEPVAGADWRRPDLPAAHGVPASAADVLAAGPPR